MKKQTLLALAIFGLLAPTADALKANAANSQADKQFKDSLQGKWQMIGRKEDGVPSERELINNRTITFTGDKYVVKDRDTVIAEPNYKFDLTKTPAWFEVAHADGNHASGIIKVEGETLTICVALRGSRPNDFKSEPGDGRLVLEFKRAKS